jgi:predicted nucleic acid-binding protein
MKKLRVYIDTSVIGGCFDREFAADSNALFQNAEDGAIKLVVSDVLAAEIENAPEEIRQFYASLPDDLLEVVAAGPEADSLHEAYLRAGVVGPASGDDAMHVAIATVLGCDIVVSWNFKHIVHYDKIRAYNAVNLREGYSMIAIHSPTEVV